MNLFKRLRSLYGPLKIRADFFFQTVLKRKSYMALGFLAMYVPVLYLTATKYEKETSLYITKGMEHASEWEVPEALRGVVFGAYAKYYGVNTEEMVKPLGEYRTFSEFFTRKVKQRPVPKEQNVILSPSDSKILSFGQIKGDSVFVVKGYSYSLGHLLCGQDVPFTEQDIRQMKRQPKNKLYHVVLYLSPGDYHRFHSVTGFEVVRRKLIEGGLLAVNEKTLVEKKKVYEKNSRLILHGKWREGYLGMVLVGALNVGRIVVKDRTVYERGEEIGYFNLGSTIVLLFEAPEVEWKIDEQQKVRYNDIIGLVKSEKTKK